MIQTDYLKLRDEILTFNKLQYSGVYDNIKAYLNYRFEENPLNGEFPSSLFAIKDGEVTGQIIMLPSKIMINGELKDFYWGTDFVVDEKLRGQKIGAELLKEFLKFKHIISGLNRNSLPMVLKLGENVIGSYTKFLWLNPAMIKNRFIERKMFLLPDEVTSGSIKFSRYTTPGFRNTEFNPGDQIETGRSADFISWRFFYKPGKYFVYSDAGGDGLTYFVVRVIKFRKMNMLFLVDFRFAESSLTEFAKIVKAAKLLTKELKLCGIVTFSTYEPFGKFLKRKFFYPYTSGQIVSNFITAEEVQRSGGLLVTPADSDGDFYFSNNPWSFS